MSVQTQRDRFRGVFALLLTPFRHSGEIDWDVYDRYVDWQLSYQPHGLFAVCGSSEMMHLTFEERIALAERAVKRAGGVPVVATANVGRDVADHERELARMAETGVAGVVLIPPDGMGEDQRRLGDYFARMAEISPVPVMLYECPMVKPHLIDAGIYSELVRRSGIFGIKDTTSTLEGIRAKIEGAPEGIVYQANNPLMLDALRIGAGGIMATPTTAAVYVALDLWSKAATGAPDAEKALERLVFLIGVLDFGYTATAKYLVSLQGVPMESRSRGGSALTEWSAKAVRVWYESTLS